MAAVADRLARRRRGLRLRPLGGVRPDRAHDSHHRKVLREAGLIIGERRGTWIYYRVQPDAQQLAAWFMLVVALCPLGDTLIVLRHGGTRAMAFGIHFATAVVVLASAALLFAV